MSTEAVTDYAVNGAYHYASHIAKKSPFTEVFAVGVSGDSKHHTISPVFVNDREGYKRLPDLESFTWLSPSNIVEYYTRMFLTNQPTSRRPPNQILKDAAELHEYLRTYGSIKDQDKAS